MMLRQLVESLEPDWKPRAAPFPATLRVAEARRAVEDGQERREPPRLELSALALARLRARLFECHRAGDWGALVPRDWRYANECLSIGEAPLIDDPGFITAFLLALKAHRSTPFSVNLLARWYVRSFEPDHDGIRQIGRHLAAHLPSLRPSWIALHDRCGIFDPDRAVPALAARLGAPGTDPAAVLGGLSCPPSLLSSRLFGHVFAEVCRTAATEPPRDIGWIGSLTGWAFGSNGVFQHGLIPGAAEAYAEAMLRPWIGRFPDEEVRSLTVGRLLGLMLDPRTNPAGWSGVSEPARAVMLGWMTKDVLEQFLEVVDETVQAYQSRIWAERRLFWLSYYDRQYIRECWVVFGRRGAALARHLAVRKDNPSLTHFANFLRDVGGDPNQAVLLMRIGPLLVADWSHNGRCHIWLRGNPAAPRLYQAEYLREDLMSGADFEAPHHKNWQAGIEGFITSHLGVEPPSRA